MKVVAEGFNPIAILRWRLIFCTNILSTNHNKSKWSTKHFTHPKIIISFVTKSNLFPFLVFLLLFFSSYFFHRKFFNEIFPFSIFLLAPSSVRPQLTAAVENLWSHPRILGKKSLSELKVDRKFLHNFDFYEILMLDLHKFEFFMQLPDSRTIDMNLQHKYF